MAFNKGKGSYGGGAGKSYGRDREGGSGRSFEKRSYGGAGGAGRSFGGGRTGGGLELFDVTCAQCGTHTQVPFKPTGERPVLCRDCFKGGDSGPRDAPRSAPRGNAGGGDSSRELREISEKLDKIMRALDIE